MKVYVKSVTNISDIQAKIAKKQADIQKKSDWIKKKEASIEKRFNILEPLITPEEFERVKFLIEYLKSNNSYRVPQEYEVYDISRKYTNTQATKSEDVYDVIYGLKTDAESIYNSSNAIKEYQETINKYNEKLSGLRAKGEEIDRIPDVLKSFMNDVIKNWDEHDLWLKNEGKPYYKQLNHDAWVLLYGDTASGNGAVAKAKLAELYPDIEESDRYYRDIRRQKFDEDYVIKPFERKYGSLNYARSIWDYSDEEIHKRNQRDGENLILDLLKRVTKITGPVTDWSELELARGNHGLVINGYVSGEDGKAKVESIVAGGYHIQRAHIRTLVHEVK